MKIKLILLWLIASTQLFGQFNINSVKFYGDSLNNNGTSFVKNNKFLWFVSTSDLGGNTHFILTKIKTNLDTVFTKNITPNNTHYNPKIQIYNDTIYVAGYTNTQGLLDLEVIKLDTVGNILQTTYFGGSSSDILEGFIIDNFGNLVLSGKTVSSDFPCLGNSFQSLPPGPMDACLLKVNRNLNVLWSTYFGGASYDDSHTLTVDILGDIYIAGNTMSPNLPITSGAYQNTLGGGFDCYIAKFSKNGNLLHSTFLGGSGTDEFLNLSVDGNKLYAVGYTNSNDFPGLTLTNGLDALISKLDTSLNFINSVNIGGSNQDIFNGISILNNRLLVVGETDSPDLTTINPIQALLSGSNDMLISVFDSNLTQLTTTYLGGTNYDVGFTSVYLDSIYILGRTQSSPFPFQSNSPYGSYDNIIIKLQSSVYNYINEYTTPIIRIYPNPTKQIVNFGEVINNVEIYDYSGKLIKSEANTDKIDIEWFSDGFYILKLDNTLYKVIKE